MDTVTVLQGGRLADHGPYENIRTRVAVIIGQEEAEIKPGIEFLHGENNIEKHLGPSNPTGPVSGTDERMSLEVADPQRRQSNWTVYQYYFRSVGTLIMSLWVSFTVLGAVTASLTSKLLSISMAHPHKLLTHLPAIWIDIWTDANQKNANQHLGFYLGVYALLVILSIAGVAGECWCDPHALDYNNGHSNSNIGSSSSTSLIEQLLKHTLIS